MQGLPSMTMDRRALIRGAILMVGGSIAAGAMPDLAFAQTAAFFTPAERAVLDAYCATLIPKTDTPGAIEAGVPGFLDGMMTNWASDNTRAGFRSALAEIDESASFALGKGFAALTPEQQLAVLTTHDAEAFAARNGPYRRLKELALTGYYLSEVGATQELRYELAPGVWEPSIPMTPDTRAWAV